MSGTHERVAPREKTNFASGAVVSRLTSEPLSGRFVPRRIPSDSLSLNSAVSINQSGPSASDLLGKPHPTKEPGLKPNALALSSAWRIFSHVRNTIWRIRVDLVARGAGAPLLIAKQDVTDNCLLHPSPAELYLTPNFPFHE
ncbi:unnamed protein product [Pleuronectes platessa]|uniref:Uncharacterized protein n=1 Tax=Pleuronectes platessa TaxID=8262 RepID=A0A9N7ZCJ1_PLEPL|nr:unnamed protein product [Pleuronectes platessa]